MNKQVIIINGSGGSGKDQLVKLISQQYKTTNISSVDKVKLAAEVLGWDGSKEETDRKFLSDLKLLSAEYCNHPFLYMYEKIRIFQNDDNDLLFLHIREPKEIQQVKLECIRLGVICKTLLINRKEVGIIKSNMADGNVENYNYDYIIHNDGTLGELLDKGLEVIKEELR